MRSLSLLARFHVTSRADLCHPLAGFLLRTSRVDLGLVGALPFRDPSLCPNDGLANWTRLLKRMLIRSELIALPPRLGPTTKGKGRSTAQHVDRRRHEQRRTNVVQDRTIEVDKRLSNTLKYTNENTLDEIEYLRLFKSAVHAL